MYVGNTVPKKQVNYSNNNTAMTVRNQNGVSDSFHSPVLKSKDIVETKDKFNIF